MPDELRVAGALLVSLIVAYTATPWAIRLAHRLDFHDQPNVDYKRHRPATPYLGGTAIIAGLLAGALLFGGGTTDYAVIVAGAALLWVVGTVDDRRSVSPLWRVAIEVGLAAWLWSADLGWHVFASDGANLALTAFWVVGIVNACNMFDNMDGSAATVVGVCAAGAGSMALAVGDPVLAALCLAVTGACVGFLPFNLPPPARIFMGDGGSMPIGFTVAAAAMALPLDIDGASTLLLGGLLLALPIFDTTMVSLSRHRRGVSLFKGGRDHTTHRLAFRVGSTWKASLLLGAAQATISVLAVVAHGLGESVVVELAAACTVLGLALVLELDSPRWRAAYEPAAAAPVLVRESGAAVTEVGTS